MIKSNSIVERRANEIIELFEIQYPVDLNKLSHQIGIEIIDKYNLKVDGYLYRDLDCKLIFINNRIKNTKKRRFIIAHELGHYFLHSKETLQICSGITEAFNKPSVISNSEKEANKFAAELLAPINLVQELLPKQSISFNIIGRLAYKFDISITSMAIKCVENSKSESETLLCIKNNILQWFASSDVELREYNIPSSSPYGSLIYDVINGMNREMKKRIGPNVWNIYRGEVDEEILSIGNNTYLVLLCGLREDYC